MRLERTTFFWLVLYRDPFGGPAEDEKVFRVEMDEIGAKNVLASAPPGDYFGGPAKVVKVMRVEMDEIGAINVLASTPPGDYFGGPAEVVKVIRVEMDEIGVKRFWLLLYWFTRR